MPYDIPFAPDLPTPGDLLAGTGRTVSGIANKVDDVAKKDEKATLSGLAGTAGFSGEDAVKIAPAVALAESGGNPKATNKNSNGTQDTGLWQINDVHFGSAPGPKDSLENWHKWLKNPQNNADAAYWVFSQQGWNAWTTYRNGKYKKYLGKDKTVTVDKNSLVGDTIDEAKNVVSNPVDAVAGFLSSLTSASTWFRIGKTSTGMGLVMLGTGTLLVLAISKTARTPVGKAVNGSIAGGAARNAARGAREAAKTAKDAAAEAAETAAKVAK